MKHTRMSALLLAALAEGDGGEGGGTSAPPADSTPPAPPNGDQGGAPATDTAPTANADQQAAPPAEDVDTWKGHARTWEHRAKDHKTAAEKAAAERDQHASTIGEFKKLLGLDDSADPAKVAEQAQQTVAQREAELTSMRRERAAERAAYAAGVNVEDLLDSRGFAGKLEKLDPTGEAFADEVRALITAQVEARPSLKAAPPAAPAGPPATADHSGGGEPRTSSGPQSVEDFRKARISGPRRH